MSKRIQRRRRIALLLGIIIIIIAGVGGLAVFRSWQKEHQAMAARANGLTAYESGQYAEAINHLDKYLQEHQNDPAALYRYGKSKLEVPDDEGRHRGQAAVALKKVFQLNFDEQQPDDLTRDQYIDAGHELLRLFAYTSQNAEILQITDHLLELNTEDSLATHHKALAHSRLNEHEQALKTALYSISLNPDDLPIQLLILRLKKQLGESDDALIEYAEELLENNPDDPRIQLIQAYAYGIANRIDESRQWLLQASRHNPPDADFTHALLQLLDNAGLYAVSITALEKHPSDQLDLLNKELICRLFEAERYKDTIDRIASLPLPDESRYIQLHALSAVSHYRLGEKEKADDQVEMIVELGKSSPTAQAWADILTATQKSDKLNLEEIISSCLDGLAIIPDEPYFNAFIATAYTMAGENQQAMMHWQKAAEHRDTWAAPLMQQAKILLKMNRPLEAVDKAAEAYRKAPKNIDVNLTFAESRIAALNDNTDDHADAVLAYVDKLIELLPGNHHLLLMRTLLLAEAGNRAEAETTAKQLISASPPAEKDILSKLLDIAETHQLECVDACRQTLSELHGHTAEQLLQQALEAAATGGHDAFIDRFDKIIASAEEYPADALEWKLAKAKLLEAVDDPGAPEFWLKLADTYPDNTLLLRTVLRANSIATRLGERRKIIDRLRDITGPEAITWKLEQARWLLDSKSDEKQITEAISILREVIAADPYHTHARILLASCHEKLGNIPLAVRQMEEALKLHPKLPAVHLELARLQQKAQAPMESLKHLDHVLSNPQSSDQDRQNAAILLAQIGQDEKAIDILEQLKESVQPDTSVDLLLLASLYKRNDRIDEAVSLCRNLLNQPTPDRILFTATLFYSEDLKDEADQAINMLGDLNIPPVERLLLTADYYHETGRIEQALKHYQAAVEADPDNPIAHRRLIYFYMLQGEIDQVINASDKMLETIPDDTCVALLKTNQHLLDAFLANVQTRPVVTAVIQNPDHCKSAIEVLQILHDADQGKSINDTVASRIQSIAEANPDFLALQNLLTQIYLGLGRHEDALKTATSAMARFPHVRSPVLLATEACVSGGKWQQALETARLWRKRSPDDKLSADIVIAQAYLKTGRVDQADKTIVSYLDDALRQPEQHSQVISLYCRILIADGRINKAAELLQPLLVENNYWKILWLELAGSSIQDNNKAGEWLTILEATLTQDDTDVLISLARQWLMLARQFNNEDGLQHARRIAEQLVENNAASHPDAWFTRGLIAETQNDLQAAEESYRRTIALSDEMPMAKNNLAMILLQQSKDLEEAVQLATQAVEDDADNTYYLDTLARIQVRTDQCSQAIANMNKATRLEPNNPQWQQSLSEILEACREVKDSTE